MTMASREWIPWPARMSFLGPLTGIAEAGLTRHDNAESASCRGKEIAGTALPRFPARRLEIRYKYRLLGGTKECVVAASKIVSPRQYHTRAQNGDACF